jgi:hypothetical protein
VHGGTSVPEVLGSLNTALRERSLYAQTTLAPIYYHYQIYVVQLILGCLALVVLEYPFHEHILCEEMTAALQITAANVTEPVQYMQHQGALKLGHSLGELAVSLVLAALLSLAAPFF